MQEEITVLTTYFFAENAGFLNDMPIIFQILLPDEIGAVYPAPHHFTAIVTPQTTQAWETDK
ncbi:hypothetical protein L1S32_11340 [Methanogenium sp. S4BF]|uniref:hypothetical protein n=1 Tax=Methanogenium sp. S4BF TaxID=1789226 RepID=UPI00241620A4|nr:hypothetical protein [Methanogenium sp. S4BF]WFN34417.1 hypothetical protein L1S32_11340 [Methanogenium sp. S4BF]